MFETFSTSALEMIDKALRIAKSLGKKLVGTEHLLLAMYQVEESICHFLLEEKDITYEKLLEVVNGLVILRKNESKEDTYSKKFQEVILYAQRLSEDLESEYVYDEHIFYVMLKEYDTVAYVVLEKLGLDIEELKRDIEEIFSFDEAKEKENIPYPFLINLSTSQKIHPFVLRNNYIEKIKELSKTHFILVLSHAFNTLIKNNIKPDAIVSTDGGFYSCLHIIDAIKENIPIFTTHSAYSFPLTNINKKRIFYFSHNESFEKIIYSNKNSDNNIYFPMEGSVIMPALRIANFLNPKYILFAGCDFCHLNNKSHSKYSNAIALDFITSNKINTFETKKYKRLNDDNKIECFDDCLRNTSSSLLSYKAHFESLVADLSKNINFFTLTKESSKIKNVNIYNDNIKGYNKQLKDFKHIEEKQNKELLKNKLLLLKKAINSNNSYNNFSDDIDEILNMISPWHRDSFIEEKIKYDELKDYINKWYNDISIFLD